MRAKIAKIAQWGMLRRAMQCLFVSPIPLYIGFNSKED